MKPRFATSLSFNDDDVKLIDEIEKVGVKISLIGIWRIGAKYLIETNKKRLDKTIK